MEKQRHEEALQRYQEDHTDGMEIIKLHIRCSKTGAKAETKKGAKAVAKAGSKTGAKAAGKAPRSGYHFFLREQFENMTGEDRRNYRNIVSRRWKEIKEDPARLSAYNDRARQIKDVDPSVSSMEQQTMTERQFQKVPQSPEFVDTDSDDSDTEDEEEQEPAVKQPKEVPKSPEFVDTDPDDSDNEEEEPHPQKTFPGTLEKEPTQPVKTPSAANRIPVTSCTYILTFGLRKGK